MERTELNGCAQLWAGVEILVLGRIRANQSTFEDAKAAIILRHLSTIEATHNVFRKNYCGIVGVSANSQVTSSTILLASAKGISGNVFYGNDELLETVTSGSIVPGLTEQIPNHATRWPYAGIWLERIQSLTVGHLTDDVASPVNIF